MHIWSWNVNGLRACARKGFLDWLADVPADVVALQEVRATLDDLPRKVAQPDGWFTHFSPAERKGYSGVGLYARQQPDHVDTRLGVEHFDSEGRLQFATFGELLLVNGYFPNGSGKNRDNSRIPFKLEFYRTLHERLRPDLEAGRPIVVVGDFNTAHAERDLARPRQNHRTSGFCPEEREELDRWLRSGWVDTFRVFEPGEGHYSWWSNRPGVRQRNVGWRIDYILASPGAAAHLQAAGIAPDVMGSDHCPVHASFDRAILGTSASAPAPPER